MEVKQMVSPLVANVALLEALKAYIRASPFNDKLRQLVQHVSSNPGLALTEINWGIFT